MSRIVVVAAHPQLERSRTTRAMLRAAAAVPGVALRDLYALYPDFFVDVAAERAALADAELVVWLHPLHWYGMTPLLKLWLDEVFGFGWAYGPGGHALAGKDLWLAVSAGGRAEAYRSDGYNRYFIDAFWPPVEQTATLAGMRFLPPLVLFDALRASDAAIEAHAARFAERLASYPDWPELAELEPCAQPAVPGGERPAEEAD